MWSQGLTYDGNGLANLLFCRLLMISCGRLQTPGSFGKSGWQSVCSAVIAYYLYKCSLMHRSLLSCSFKEQIHSFPGLFRCQFFCSSKCGGCLSVHNPSWLSSLWKGFCFMLDPCMVDSHVCAALQWWFCRVQKESWIGWWTHWFAVAKLEQFSCLKTWVWD